jgi:hypothetical protein
MRWTSSSTCSRMLDLSRRCNLRIPSVFCWKRIGLDHSYLCCAKELSGESPEIKLFAYRGIPGFVRSKDRTPARLRVQPQDLNLVPSDVAPPDRLRLGLRRRRPRSWLCFAPVDPSVAGGGNPATSCRQWFGVDGGGSWARSLLFHFGQALDADGTLSRPSAN